MAQMDNRPGIGQGNEQPLYGGERPRPASGGGGLESLRGMGESYAPAQRALETANRNLANAGYAFDDALRIRLDWTLQQQRATEAKTLAASAQAELDHRLQLADGADGSFFNADHTFNERELAAFMQTYTSQVKGWDKGFITPEYQQDAQESMNNMRAGLQAQIAAGIGRATFARANASLMQGFNERLALGDFEGAMAYAVEGVKAGGAHEADLYKMHRKACRAYAQSRSEQGRGDTKITIQNLESVSGDDIPSL